MKKISAIILILLSSNLFYSQTKDSINNTTVSDNEFIQNEIPDPVFTMDIDFNLGFPKGEFKQNYPNKLIGGFSFTGLIPFDYRNPLDIGFRTGYYWMSQTSETYSYYEPFVGDYDVTSKIRGRMIPINLVLRVNPLRSIKFPIQPYIEGYAGFRFFSANHTLETQLYNPDTTFSEKDYNLSASWSYGFGAGLKLFVFKGENLVSINLKVSKLYGTNTRLLDPSSIKLYSDGTYEFSHLRSRTDILNFSIGINLMIE